MAKLSQQNTQHDLSKSTGPIKIEDATQLLRDHKWPSKFKQLVCGVGRGEEGVIQLYVMNFKQARELGIQKYAGSLVPYTIRLKLGGEIQPL